MMKSPFKQRRRGAPERGFSLVEIVIGLIILSTLTLMLVPTVQQRSRQARITTAQSEVDALANAESRAATDTSFMYRLYALDDVSGPGDNIANELNQITGVESIRDVEFSTVHRLPAKMFIDTFSQNLSGDFTELFARLTRNETAFGWNGPYLNWKRDVNGNDWPDDPWGSDYILFTKRGGLFPNNNQDPPRGTQDDQFENEGPTFTTVDGRTAKARINFDRPNILSLGPNRKPGDGTSTAVYGTGDDIYRPF